MEDSKLFFSLDRRNQGPIVAFSKDKPEGRVSQPDLSLGMDLDLSQGYRSQAPFLPHSPSSPGSLADLSSVAAAGHLVTNNLVKSSSTDLEPGEGGNLRGKPLLSLVKSLSTEISRRVEPEVNLSKSDSKLHLYPWKQLSQPKIPEVKAEAAVPHPCNERTSSSVVSSVAAAEPRGSLLIAELEDTRRKFSEAMHDPLSVLSKMMSDDGSSSSPKQGRTCTGCCGRDEDAGLRCRKADSEQQEVCNLPPRGCTSKSSTDRHLEIQTHGDMIQVVEILSGERTCSRPQVKMPGSPVPLHWLLPVGLLAYSFLVLPLPPYLTGLLLGVALGFMLGLFMVFTFAPRSLSKRSKRGDRWSRSRQQLVDDLDGELTDRKTLEGWMNETDSYDPESFHPSLMHSVHVTVDGGRLCLQQPQSNIPRWASFDEVPHEASLSRSRTYHLANSKVSLLPPGLARKRLWNRKYPICITLADGEVGEEHVPDDQGEECERVDGQTTATAADHQHPVTLYLFGRTGREKEEWFQHFLSASRTSGKCGMTCEESTEASCCSDAPRESTEGLHDPPAATRTRTALDYSTYMTQLIISGSSSPTGGEGSPTFHKKHSDEDESGGHGGVEPAAGPAAAASCSVNIQPMWVNSLVGRIFWDFLQENYWSDQVAQKIQKKLSKIKLPYFMNELTLADLDMGTCLPQVLSTSTPTLDNRGLWLELEVVYTGCFQMTLETKMNLCKLGKDVEDEAHNVQETLQIGSKPRLCILADSDEESSSAGSSDEEEAPPTELQGFVGDKSTAVVTEGHTGGSTGRKILRFVDKIAKSKYFQKATENEFIRKKIAEVSNMPLMLSVEVLELSGTLAINIPPPPTDRIWYSFRTPPRLDLNVRPTLGEREVTFTHVTEWIEKKLQCEFQKVFVMPNMDDLYLPLMTSALENPAAPQQSSDHITSKQSSVESQDYLSE